MVHTRVHACTCPQRYAKGQYWLFFMITHLFFETTSLTEPEVHQLARLENLPIPTGRIKVGFYVGARESD